MGMPARRSCRRCKRVCSPSKSTPANGPSRPGDQGQRWQAFLTTMPWDAEALNRQRVQTRSAEAPGGADRG